ncbi:MAG: bifunctional DNA primase/polymerase, partial [Candidatus Aenigmarchaeota archaeon]|nr:bifunctional DNA primase/polymerase [Candidatus Aenigmarchaeota archaeon]
MLLQIPQCSLPSVAECFLRAGFSIIPVKPDTKEPAVRWKPYMNQLMNVELVDEFFHRNSNIAIVTGEASKLTVFDIDDIEKFNQFYDFEQLKNEAGTIVKTPRGYHLYFTYEPDLKTKQHQDFGFDIKNEGALVTAPPSTVNGHVYFFEKANGLGEIPKDLKEKITSLQRAKNDCFDEILSKLRVVRQLPDGTYRCFCPAHDDQEPSLDVGLKNNRLYIHCWAGCSKKEVLEAIGFEQKETKEERDNTAKKLLQLVENFQLWTNQNGEEFISLPEGNLRIESKEFKKYLQLLFYQKYGKPAHTQAVLEAVSTLSGKAIFEGEKQKSFIRVGKIENFIELDLCNGYAVRIDRENIRVSKPYCKFERPASLLPLPIPDLNIEGDEWKFLKHFINTNNDGVVLILGWLVGCFNLDGEFPILNIVGEREGVGKTTASKFLKSIIDPAVVLTKPLPKTEDDLLAVCLH